MKGSALKLLETLPGCPTAIALDLMVGEMRVQLANMTGGWTPDLVLNRAATVIDAEMRLGTGGDMKGVAMQVGALCLIALEKLELES